MAIDADEIQICLATESTMHVAVVPVFRALGIAAATGLIVYGALSGRAASAQTGASRFALATVNDTRGRPVVDVGADDFVVQEGSEGREVLSVRVADYPIALVVDNGSDTGGEFPFIQKALTRLLERLGPRPVAIVTVAGRPKVVASFEHDRPIVLERLAAIDPAPEIAGRPVAGAALAAQTIRASGALFSAIVVVTGSRAEPHPETATSSESPDSAPALMAPVIDSGAVMHVIAKQAELAPRETLLRTLAEQTHGQFTPIYSVASYQPAIDRLTERLTTELLIEYLVPVGSRSQDVKIGVRLSGARVRGLGVAPGVTR